MATAPRPGTTGKKKGPEGFRITVREEGALVRPDDIGPRDDALVRRETKAALGEPRSLMAAVQQLADANVIGLDTMALLWWWGRVKAGDTTESFGEALDRFPSLGELDDVLTLELLGGEEVEEGGDPLPSAAA